MILTCSVPFFLLISAVRGCTDPDCDEINTNLDRKYWSPKFSYIQKLILPPPEKDHDGRVNNILERIKSKRVQSSDLAFRSFRDNAELSRTLLQQIIQNVHRFHNFQPRSNRADSKENYHLQASYIPRLG